MQKEFSFYFDYLSAVQVYNRYVRDIDVFHASSCHASSHAQRSYRNKPNSLFLFALEYGRQSMCAKPFSLDAPRTLQILPINHNADKRNDWVRLCEWSVETEAITLNLKEMSQTCQTLLKNFVQAATVRHTAL